MKTKTKITHSHRAKLASHNVLGVPRLIVAAYRAAEHIGRAATTATIDDPDAIRAKQHALEAETIALDIFYALIKAHGLNPDEITAKMEIADASYTTKFARICECQGIGLVKLEKALRHLEAP